MVGNKKKRIYDQEPVRVLDLFSTTTEKKTVVCMSECLRTRTNWMTGRRRYLMLYSIFSCSFLWKHTGRIETTARTPSTASEYQDTASPAVVSLYSVVPAFIATNDGGATPERDMREHIKPVYNAINIHTSIMLSHLFRVLIRAICLSHYFQISTRLTA